MEVLSCEFLFYTKLFLEMFAIVLNNRRKKLLFVVRMTHLVLESLSPVYPEVVVNSL